ncbi:hypothetical protein [Brumimicrobium mesophilum]|uniref:hypothetical protein n=1 Tax=Brumimicrobium mesophilum TaxID=392717 RepID=UPI001F16D52C|nr:hypothetical protein [Brumimicrobium mesophilum]
MATEVPAAKYVDENWGQLDYYSPNFPVQWPCILIDVNAANFTNIGKDRSATPENRQMGEFSLELRIANLKLTNTSYQAPTTQKTQARSIWTLIDEVHKVVQGFEPDVMFGKLIRTGWRRVPREDGVQEYAVYYRGKADNV